MRKIFVFLVIIFLVLAGGVVYYYFYYSNEFTILDVEYENNFFTIKFSETKSDSLCAVMSDDDYKNNKEDITFVDIEDNICKYQVNDYGNYEVYVKNNDEIYKVTTKPQTFDINIDKKKYYLALEDTTELEYDVLNLGKGSFNIISNNSDIASVYNNVITANNVGETEIKVSTGDYFINIKVIVTDLINKIPKSYVYNREYVPCNSYSFSEARLLDNILDDRINEAGFKTRAGVVAAARFLLLEFPYKIRYFSENGRLSNYNGERLVDGEGRYYHKGLYLTSDKFDDIKYVDMGPNPWGCPIYSRPSEGYRANGLDCSGFTTWALYNGGFDVEDLGAHGGNDLAYDLNDIGEENILTNKLIFSDKIKAGDLLGEVSKTEGHSALIVGIDNENYYVAESLWIEPLGLNINTYKKEELLNYFETVNLMDSYYKKDGNYSSMWY